MTEKVFKNQALWDRMRKVFPGFSWKGKESLDGRRRWATFTNWPTRGASLSPLRKGSPVSMEDITEYLEALEKGLPPAHKFDSLELQAQVDEMCKRRKILGKRRPRTQSIWARA